VDAFYLDAEQLRRPVLEKLAATKQGDELLQLNLRLRYGSSLLGEITPVRNHPGPGSLLVKEKTPPEIEPIEKAFGAEVAQATRQRVLLKRAQVAGEGEVLVFAPCRGGENGVVSGVYWLSPKRTLTLRALEAVDPEKECPEPIDIADLDGDGLPEVIVQGGGEAWVWSVSAEGSRLRWTAEVHDGEQVAE
jgi:hypothetical protein